MSQHILDSEDSNNVCNDVSQPDSWFLCCGLWLTLMTHPFYLPPNHEKNRQKLFLHSRETLDNPQLCDVLHKAPEANQHFKEAGEASEGLDTSLSWWGVLFETWHLPLGLVHFHTAVFRVDQTIRDHKRSILVLGAVAETTEETLAHVLLRPEPPGHCRPFAFKL